MNNDDRLLLKVDEAAARLNISKSYVYKLIKEGELNTIKIGKSRRVPLRALHDFVARKSAT